VEWQLVDSDAALRQLLGRARGRTVVAVDTEFMRRNTFFPEVALVQLCFGGGATGEDAWLIDPLALGDPSPLAGLLTDPGVEKILHSASEDLEVFQHWLGVLPRPLFDTQRAAALLDLGFGLGYRALVLELCGVDLPKGETRSDWLQRPLSQAQCDYAAQDVTWLVPVYRELHARCVAQHKLAWVLEDGADAASALGTASDGYHRRIKSAWKLDACSLGALAAICQWREDTARRRNKPRNWIIDDRTCLQLAEQDPRTREELGSRVALPQGALRRYGDELLALLERQRQQPPEALPAPLPGPLDAGERQQLRRLKAAAREIARRLAMAPEALLQSRDYETLLREASGEPVAVPRHWLGWRREQVVEPLRRLLGETPR
jgi:ribonuclease D